MQMQSVATNAGTRDLLRAVEDRACTKGLFMADVAVDVLDLDGRVVDEDADRERRARRASSR